MESQLDLPFPRRATLHKRDFIDHLIALYVKLPFVSFGDSGRKDPESYAQIMEEHPGRIRAFYIREVSKAGERDEKIGRLSAPAAAAGS